MSASTYHFPVFLEPFSEQRKAIFKAEGLDPNDYEPAVADAMLEDLLLDNSKKYGYELAVPEAHRYKDLTKFSYIVDNGVTQTEGQASSSGMVVSATGDFNGNSDFKAVQDVRANVVKIKLEYAQFNRFAQQLSVSKQGKAKLIKLKNQMEDINTGLRIKQSKDPLFTSKVELTSETLIKISETVTETTKSHILWGALTKDDEIADDLINMVSESIKNLDAWCTTMAEFKKDMSKLL